MAQDRRIGPERQGSNRPPLALHVPEPRYRPGDAVDFSHLDDHRPPARSRAPTRPAPRVETYPLCTDLIRVLGDDDQAHGPWDPRLDRRNAAPDAARRWR